MTSLRQLLAHNKVLNKYLEIFLEALISSQFLHFCFQIVPQMNPLVSNSQRFVSDNELGERAITTTVYTASICMRHCIKHFICIIHLVPMTTI